MKIIDKRQTQKNQKKTNKQTNKDKKEQGELKILVKGLELNDFVVHLS